MLKNILFLLFVGSLLGIQSCSDDDMPENQAGEFDTGSFIIYQSTFGSGHGDIYHIGDDNSISRNVYRYHNNLAGLGNVVQSMIINNGTTLISVNNNAEIVGVNSGDFLHKYSIPIIQPRYFATLDEEHVVASAWGETGFNGSIYKINSASGEIIMSNEIGGAPEKMIVNEGKIYITMSNGFQTDNRVVILNANDLSFRKELTVASNPTSIVLDSNDDIWVTSSGYSDWNDPSNNTSGNLIKIIDDEVANTFDVENGSSGLALDDSFVYYLNSAGLIKANKSNVSQIDTLFTGSFYALGLNSKRNDLWVADAKDFSANGLVSILDKDGQVQATYPTGPVPGDFYFVE